MGKNIVETYGFHWVLLGLFVVACVIAGFVVFPSIVLVFIWDHLLVKFIHFLPKINLVAGLLLWGITAITLYITTKDKFKTSYENGKKISRLEFREIIQEARSRGIPLKFLQKHAQKHVPNRKRKRG